MNKLIVFVGDIEDKLAVAEVLMNANKKVTRIFSVYGGIETTLSETFKRPVGKDTPGNFEVEVQEAHLRRFFSKMAWGVHAVTNFVGKKLTNSNEMIDYFVNKVGGHCQGHDFLYKAAAESIRNQPAGVYLIIDVDMVEAKKMLSLLPGCASIVQITKPDGEHEEGLPFFAFDRSEKSWKKDVIKMFESFNEKTKEKVNGKQRNA
jgi:hypothetical protein